MLAEILIGMIEKYPGPVRATRVVLPSNPGDPHYAFLLMPRFSSVADAKYREVRYRMLEALCMVAKLKFPDAQDIVASALGRTYPALLSRSDPGILISATDRPRRRMVTMKHHHARGPEETVCDLPPLVPAGRASRRPPTCLWQTGMPSRAAAEDASQLAPPAPGLRHRLAD
jgi:hypothetical protein